MGAAALPRIKLQWHGPGMMGTATQLKAQAHCALELTSTPNRLHIARQRIQSCDWAKQTQDYK
eukprot:15465383-Alexandrium_andersonii.AAC.1